MPSPVLRVSVTLLAALYTVMSMLFVIAAWPGRGSDPTAMTHVLMLAMPWTLVLSLIEGGVWRTLAVALLGLAVNVTLLWWLALRRRPAPLPAMSSLRMPSAPPERR